MPERLRRIWTTWVAADLKPPGAGGGTIECEGVAGHLLGMLAEVAPLAMAGFTSDEGRGAVRREGGEDQAGTSGEERVAVIRSRGRSRGRVAERGPAPPPRHARWRGKSRGPRRGRSRGRRRASRSRQPRPLLLVKDASP